METMTLGTVLALLGLGAVHGINPGMGWLFAVALGLQEGSARAVWRALPPLAVGHAAAVAVAVATAALLGLLVPLSTLRWVVAAVLLGLGLYRLRRHRHPRGGGMRVGARDLALWSFLMASAHGAGLMVLPVLLRGGAAGSAGAAGGGHAGHVLLPAHTGHTLQLPESTQAADGVLAAGAGVVELTAILPTVLHTFGYLLVAGAVAFIVYRKLGLRLLRRAWINLDLIWAAALVLTALLTVAV
jgi:hypothetical protein